MTNSMKISAEISTKGQKLEKVTSSKYLGATLCKDGTCSASPHQDCLSKGINVQTKQDQAVSNFASLWSPPSSSTGMKHGPCLLTEKKKDPSFRKQVHEDTSPYLLLGAQDDRLDPLLAAVKRRKLMVLACHTPRQPLQNHSSGHRGEWATPWSVEEMLDGQHQRVDIPAHARTAHRDLLQKGLEGDLC